MPNIDLSILNQRQTPAFYADTLANRPAAGFVGRIFVSTDTYAFYRDNGTSWDLIGGPGTGTITGSGSSGSLALWNGTNTITYDVNITWDGTDNSISADKFIVNSGTSSEFLKGDGSLDSSAYVTTNIYNGNGTLSGERTISLNGNNLIFDGGASIARVRLDADTNVARIFSFATNNVARWAFRIDDAETGSNAGSNFAVRRYNDAGTFVDAPLLINRATGQSTFAKKVVIENNAGDQQLQIVSTTAPSLRIDNLQTGATKRIGLGLATAVNNFIQGSVDQDFCIFNSTTTASPILFGIYDAGLGNTQEAARISAARNFLVGTSVDSGYKIDVSGGAGRIASSSYTAGALLYLRDGAATGSNTTFAGLFLGSSPGTDFVLGKQSTNSIGSFAIKTGGGTSLFTLTDAGAATFNGNIVNIGTGTTNAGLYINRGTTANDNAVRFQTAGTNNWFFGSSATSSNTEMQLYNYGVGAAALTVAYATNNLLIGTTTDAGEKLLVSGSIATIDNYLTMRSTVNSTRYGFINEGTGVVKLAHLGVANVGQFDMTTGVYTPLSNINEKKNLELSNLGLEAVLKLKPTLYNMINQKDSEVKELGFIAQEVKEAISQAYVENGSFIGLNYQAIVATLVKAIQELNTKIENIK